MMLASPATATGRADTHLCDAATADTLGARVHVDLVGPLMELRAAAARDGFALTLDSGFRSFDRQLSIWNGKVTGARAVLDSTGAPLDITTLTPHELMLAILRWSALPGASRHHWGTDIDVFDAATTPEGYEVQLIPAEVDPGGMHGAMHAWLDERIATGRAFGFYRPYDRDRGGVAPERWHLSFAPVATEFTSRLTLPLLHDTVQGAEMALKEVVLTHLEELFERFVQNVSPPPSPSAT